MAISEETKQKFRDFMCETNDILDSAVFDLLKKRTKEAVLNVLEAYGVVEKPSKKPRFDAVKSDILAVVDVFPQSDEWNTEHIGGVEIGAEYAMDNAKIRYCHPYYTIDDPTDVLMRPERKGENDPNYDPQAGGIPCVCAEECSRKMYEECPFERG